MSGWIKMGVNLRTHPKVVRIASALNADRLRVIGALWAAWCVFDAHSADGRLDGYTLAALDEDIGWPGFGAALQNVGWVMQTEHGLQAPSYDEHNGATAKRRAMDTSRKGKSRTTSPADCPHDEPNESGQLSASAADRVRNREEKIREEKKNTHTGEALPENFALPKPWGQWAVEECPHWTAETVRAIAAQFADHHHAKGTLSLDWQATWRLWCRDPLTQRSHPPPKADKPAPLPSNTVPQSQASIAADAARKAEDMQRQAEIRAQTPEQRAEHTRIARETAERLKQRQAA